MTLDLAELAVRACGLESEVLSPRHGWSNEAWIGESVVVRLSSGRLRRSLSHEAQVLDEVVAGRVPTAEPLGCGAVATLAPDVGRSEAEWLVSRRVHGVTLATGWNELEPSARRRAGEEIGRILRAIHGVEAADIAPAWWVDAQERPEELHNCYRPPPELGRKLVASIRGIPNADQGLLDAADALVRERLELFADDTSVLVHTDIHGHNLLVNEQGGIAAVLDWEGARSGSPDIELDMFLRYVTAAHAFPERPGVPTTVRPGAMLELIDHVGTIYPELFSHPNLLERLEVHDALWHVLQLLVTQRLHGDDAAANDSSWSRLRDSLDQRSHLRALTL